MTKEDDYMDLSDLDSDDMIDELQSRGEYPDHTELSDYTDREIEDEFLSRNSYICTVIDISIRINERRSIGLNVDDDINDLLEEVKLL